MRLRLSHELRNAGVRRVRPRAQRDRERQESLWVREPGTLPQTLAEADSGARNGAVDRLQALLGNAGVQALVSRAPASGTEATETPASPGAVTSHTSTYSSLLATTIRRGPTAPGFSKPDPGAAVRLALADAPPGREEGRISLSELLEAARPQGLVEPEAAPEAEAEAGGEQSSGGSSVRLPDIEIPGLEGMGLSDTVTAALTPASSIGRGGAAPDGFGVTNWTQVSLTDIVVTPGTGAFNVTAKVNLKIEWQTRSGTGPDSQKDIASETDSDITKTNYPDVVSDLTPDTADLGGRPPRSSFWAEDLTIKHEEYHAKEMEGHSVAGTSLAQAWLGTQTASSAAGVHTLLGGVPGRILANVYAGMPEVPREERAYGDGVASYRTRAEAVKKAGEAGKYV